MKEATFQDYTERMLRVLVFIQHNLDRELSLDELSGIAHFSPFHFHRIFRGMVGESLRAHVRRIRLERAAQRLKQSDAPIVEIAFEAGYETHEAFTRAFRSMTGVAPSAFRSRERPALAGDAPSGVHYTSGGRPRAFNPVDSGGSEMKVQIRTVEPMRVAFMRHVGPYEECGETWASLCKQLGARGMLGGSTEFVGLCHDDPDVTPAEKIRYDACIKVEDGFMPEGEIGMQIIAGGEYAMATHQGPYSKLNETYAQLCGQWLPRNGRAMRSAPCFEIYLNDPEGTEPEELLTDIYIPLESGEDRD